VFISAEETELAKKEASGKNNSAKKSSAPKSAKKSARKKMADDPRPARPNQAPGPKRPSRDLPTLNEWNDSRYAHWRDPESRKPKHNEIACPNCGEELFDRTPGLIEPGNPPRIEVHCAACEYRGRRVA